MGLIGDVAKTAVVAGTWTAVSNRVSRRQAGRWAAENQSDTSNPSKPSNPSPYMPPPPGRYQRPMFQQHAHQPQPVYTYAQAVPVYHAGPQSADPMTAQLEQLRQLGNMKADGTLTEAEFEALKKRILESE